MRPEIILAWISDLDPGRADQAEGTTTTSRPPAGRRLPPQSPTNYHHRRQTRGVLGEIEPSSRDNVVVPMADDAGKADGIGERQHQLRRTSPRKASQPARSQVSRPPPAGPRKKATLAGKADMLGGDAAGASGSGRRRRKPHTVGQDENIHEDEPPPRPSQEVDPARDVCIAEPSTHNHHLEATPRARHAPARPHPQDDESDDVFAPQASNFVASLRLTTQPIAQPPFGGPTLSHTSESASTRTSSPTRAKSPVKRADDLLKLEHPVRWLAMDTGRLRQALVRRCGGDGAALFDDIRRLVELGRGHLPLELKGILTDELALLTPDHDVCFAPRLADDSMSKAATVNSVAVELQHLLNQRNLTISTPSSVSSSQTPATTQYSRLIDLLTLHTELQQLRALVQTTNAYKSLARSEAAWNEAIHGPLLALATSTPATPAVTVENITRAIIARPFLPPARSSLNLPLGGKMVDYALVLRPPPEEEEEGRAGLGLGLGTRIARFVDDLPPGETRSFNQTAYEPLTKAPAGVVVECKVDSTRYAEAQAKLGVWAAAWFGRVSSLPSAVFSVSAFVSSGDGSRPPAGGLNVKAKKPLPFLPVLLVLCDAWELWFALDGEEGLDVCGPVRIGATDSLDAAYRLLAVLRRLALWVETGFADWVAERVG